MYLYCEVWDDEEHVQGFEVGGGESQFYEGLQHFPERSPGSTQDVYSHMVECLDSIGHAGRLACLVSI